MSDRKVRSVIASRIFLGASIVVMVAILAFLAVVFVRLEQPPVDLRADQGGMQWVRSLYGSGPGPTEQINRPYSVAVGHDGRIYTAEPAGGRVLVFSPIGLFERQIYTGGRVAGLGTFAQPESIDVNAAGELFIADSEGRKIVVFDSDGRFVREWSVQYKPRGIALSAGNVFVLGEGTVNTYTESGAKLGEFGTRGPAPGQIDAYIGIEVDRDTIFIADAFNSRIQAFDRDGTLLWARPEIAPPRSMPQTPTGEPTPFAWDLPQDLTLDGAGRLVVVDAFLFQLVVLDPDTGEIVSRHGDFGTAEGTFLHPTSVDYDPQRDWFAVADTDNNRVQIVRLPGSGDTPVSGVRRIADSTARWVLPTMVLLVAVFVMSIIQWALLARNRRRMDNWSDPAITDE